MKSNEELHLTELEREYALNAEFTNLNKTKKRPD